MSFVITVYVPTGIVMASDSRQSITIERTEAKGAKQVRIETVSSDYVYKTFLLQPQQVGINSYGDTLLGKVPTETHINRFGEEKLTSRDDVTTIANKLVSFFREDFPNADTAFHVAGFKKTNGKTEPYLYRCHVGKNECERLNGPPKHDRIIYGASWGGQIDIISSLLTPPTKLPTAPVIWDAMTVQDAIDFAIYAVRTTIDTMRFQARPKNVGGPIDVLLLTPDAVSLWIQRKQFRGEQAI